MSLSETAALLDGSTVIVEYDMAEQIEGDRTTGYLAVVVNVYLKVSDGLVDMTEWLNRRTIDRLQCQVREKLLAQETEELAQYQFDQEAK